MCSAVEEPPVRLEELVILIVDDDDSDRTLVRTTLQALEKVTVEVCDSPTAMRKVEKEPHICVLDVMFNKVSRINQMIPYIKDRWPKCHCIILSNYPKEAKSFSVRFVLKPAFKSNPAVLLDELRAMVPLVADMDESFQREVLQSIDQQIGRTADVASETLLVEIEGYVVEVREPHVEVIVSEVVSPSLLDRWVGRLKQTVQKRLLMRADVFRAAGLLVEDASFTYTVIRRGSQIISEVKPRMVAAHHFGGDAPEGLPKSVDELEALQERMLREGGKASDEQPR